LSQSYVAALGLSVWGIVAVGLIDNFLSPRLVQRGIRIHPFLILLSILGGLTFFGPLGFLLGPLALSLLFALLEIYFSLQREVVA
jgi:predicted PurR-regulated permease PerM